MTAVENLKKTKAVINDLPCYMEYLPTKEQNEAFSVVLKLLDEAIEKATVLCKDCKHYVQTDPEWHCGQCKYHIGGTFAADTCDQGERKEELKPTKDLINDIVGFDVSQIKPLPEYKESEVEDENLGNHPI